MDVALKGKDDEIARLKDLLAFYEEQLRRTNEHFTKEMELHNSVTLTHHKYVEHCMTYHLKLQPLSPIEEWKFPDFDFDKLFGFKVR